MKTILVHKLPFVMKAIFAFIKRYLFLILKLISRREFVTNMAVKLSFP